MHKLFQTVLTFVTVFWLCVSSPGYSQTQADFSGKEITIIVPFKKNGGTYTWAAFNAAYLTKFLPGNPTITIKSRPGGGSTKAANAYSLNPPQDGLTLLTLGRSTQLSYVLNDPRVKYDYNDWQVLMGYPNGGVVYIKSALIKTGDNPLNSLRQQELLYASIGITSFDAVILRSLDLLKLDVTPIFGMRGREATRLAFERGDTQIDFQTSSSYINYVTPLVEKGLAVPLFTLGVQNESGENIRDPQFPDIATFEELYKNQPYSRPLAQEMVSLFKSMRFISQKLFVVPKTTPPEIVNAYENAIGKMLSDPEYQREKQRVLGSYTQYYGSTATALFEKSLNLPELQKSQLSEWLEQEYKINL